jgi:hypothetical protein
MSGYFPTQAPVKVLFTTLYTDLAQMGAKERPSTSPTGVLRDPVSEERISTSPM